MEQEGFGIELHALIKLECLKLATKIAPKGVAEKELVILAKELSAWVFDYVGEFD
jgi:hypothetical protein